MKKIFLISLLLSTPIVLVCFGYEKASSHSKLTTIPWTTQEPYVTYPCKMIEIDSQVFHDHWRLSKTIERVFPYEKIKGKLKIKSQHKTFVFRDDISDQYYHEFFPWGQFRQWLIVYGQDYHHQRFYMINLNTDSLFTLIGEPRIYDDKILCIEGDYADSPLRIELWKMTLDNLNLLFCTSLRSLGIHGIDDIYLYNNHIFLNYYDFLNSISNYYELIID